MTNRKRKILTKPIVFISDFFLEDGITGGAEAFNDELINMLVLRSYKVEKINSNLFEPTTASNENFYIVANFMNLPEPSKAALLDKSYIILEHDHKYVSTNDPSKFVNMIAPAKHIINKRFFAGAIAVFCQSKIHAEVLQKNLLLDTVVNVGCNLWSEDRLQMLGALIGTEKTKKNIILHSNNRNKGMPYAIEYCNRNNIEFELIPSCAYKDFIRQLAESERVFFFPQWLESFNRVVVEARILGCKVTSNKLIGATSEPWFRQYKGKNLLEFIRNKREEICQKFVSAIEEKEIEFIDPLPIPKISIITSLYRGGKYIEHFMSEVTKQTVFDNCELIILDANSPDGEAEVIKRYMEKYDNIIYERLSSTPTVQETMNLGIKKSSGEFLTLWNLDDTRAYGALEVMSKCLSVDPSIDLVYAESCQTNKENETIKNNTAQGNLYEHSHMDFSKENMIKCLPGPLPLWRRTMTNEIGLFDESLKYAGDWDMWLRCVDAGFKFKRIPYILGLYYMNPEGLSTSKKNAEERFKEEKEIFNKYKHVFGEKTFNQFKGYFNG